MRYLKILHPTSQIPNPSLCWLLAPMATSPDISTTLWSIPNKKELLRKAFGDLETQKATIARCLEGWKELDAHLTEMHAALEKRYEKIVEKEKTFEARIQEMQAALDKRESAIESREQASLARVQEQKDAAVAAIREQRRKWIEERQLLQNQSSAKPDLETTGSKVKQKDEIKEEDGLKGNPKEDAGFKTNPKEYAGPKGNLKEDAASKGNPKEGTGSKAKKPKEDTGSMPKRKEETKSTPKCKEETPKLNAKTGSAVNPNEESGSTSKPMKEKDNKPESEEKKDTKQETDVAEQNEETGDKQEQETDTAEESEDQGQTMEVEDEEGPKSDDENGSDDAKDEDGKKHEDEGSQKKEESSQPAVKARPQLKSLCENMDGSGLRTFVAMQKKDINVLRKEMPFALKCASDPSQLVLTALEGYYSSGQSLEGGQGKKFANRRSCITLLESLAVVLVDGGKVDSVLPPNIKEEAKKIADLWKSKLNPKGSDQLAMLDAQSFLQLLATFGLAHEYDEDELCDLVVPICTRKHIPALWRKLGLVAKAPDVVDRLIKDGKQLDAVTYIHEYQLSEQFPPVPLLKAYLKDIRKAQSNKSSSEDKNQLLMKELSAVKAVLKCVEKYKLEAEYPTEGLHKRVLQLERRNPEKKRNLDAGMGGSKKLRTNGPGGAPHSGPFRSSDRPHFGGRGMGGRNYGSGYGGGGRGGYPYPAGGPGYGSPSFPHGNYQYGGGPQSSYQGSYMR